MGARARKAPQLARSGGDHSAPAAGAQTGWGVSSAGDVNNDGYSDIIVGARSYNSNKGTILIFLGSSTGIVGSSPSDAHIVFEGDQDNAYMAQSVASAGDINEDGYSDIIIGANLYTNDQSYEGAAFIYYGGYSGFNNTPPDAINDSTTTSKNTSVVINVLSNDTDEDGDALSVSAFDSTSANSGNITDNGDGEFLYTPATDYTGSDTFTYTISDGKGSSDSGTVTITVNSGSSSSSSGGGGSGGGGDCFISTLKN